MLVQQGATRTATVDRQLAFTLAAAAGALNAAAFYAVGFFSANMTGNVSTLSDHIATAQFGPALFYLTLLAAFIGGAIVSTTIVEQGRVRQFQGVYAAIILLEAIGLFVVGGLLSWTTRPWRQNALVIALAFLMGLQNAVVTRLSDARVRTTHISGMATDIGIELGILMDAVFRKDKADTSGVKERLRLHLETLAAFLAGGVIGVLTYRWINAGLFILVALLLSGLAFANLARTRRKVEGDGEPPHQNDL